MAGVRYDGGGIARTVAATRAASRESCAPASLRASRELRAGGVTTVEIKSGYELTVEGEARELRRRERVQRRSARGSARTSCRPSSSDDRDGYVELVRGGDARGVRAQGASGPTCSVTEGPSASTRRGSILERARARPGWRPRLHANQLGPQRRRRSRGRARLPRASTTAPTSRTATSTCSARRRPWPRCCRARSSRRVRPTPRRADCSTPG